MRQTLQILSAGLVTAACITFGIVENGRSNGGGPPAGRTGGLNESTCISAGCHAGTTVSSGVTVTNFANYTPGGAPVRVTVTNSNTFGALYGFQLKIVTATNTQAGTISNVSSDAQTQLSGGRTYVNHNTPSTSGVWSFDWTPPATNVGTVTLYIASFNGNSRSNSRVTVTNFAATPVTALENPLAATDLKVFPNPAVEKATVSYKLDQEANVNITVHGLDGRLLNSYAQGSQIGTQTFTIPVSETLTRGTYLVKINADGHSVTRKLAVL